MKAARLLATAAILSVCVTAHAFEYKSIGNAPAILYDSPSQFGIKHFIAPPGMPVEVVHTAHAWSKVRDVYGDMVWVKTQALSNTRTVIVTASRVTAYQQADAEAAVAFSAGKGVVLMLEGLAGSPWIKVRHQGGQTGYLPASKVWGV